MVEVSSKRDRDHRLKCPYEVDALKPSKTRSKLAAGLVPHLLAAEDATALAREEVLRRPGALTEPERDRARENRRP